MNISYEKIILTGTGTLFLECLTYVKKLGMEYMGFDMSPQRPRMTMMQAQKKELNYIWAEKQEVLDALREEKKKTLLLSVINPFIIPADILDMENIHALNCHQALLPAHRGRNAEAWAIFEGDTVTGITWHKMTSQVDQGDILAQREISVSEQTTSFQLFRLQLRAAYEAFEEFVPKVLAGEENYEKQKNAGNQKENQIHYSWEVPAEGVINLKWSGEKISRFLRAVDYGGLNIMPKPVLYFDDRPVKISSWNIRKTEAASVKDMVRNQGNIIEIYTDKYVFTLKKQKG